MALLNISSSTKNIDGSESLFDAAGNLLGVTASDGSASIYGTAGSSLTGSAIPLWYAPAQADDLLQTIMDGGADFQATMGNVGVFKMYEAMLVQPDATLKAFFSYLSTHHIKLAIEGAALTATAGQPGYGVEGFCDPGTLKTLMTRIKTLGGDLSYIAWDEPYHYGNQVTGIALSDVAAQVAAAGKIVTSIFPHAQIGDIEPVGESATGATDLKAWFSAYSLAAGTQFDFFQADIAGWTPGWQTNFAAVAKVARADGMSVGAIADGVGTAAGDTAWATQAVEIGQQINADPRLRADYTVVQSWQANPSEAASPGVAGTLASIAQDLSTGLVSARSIPAVAQYDASGLLRSVTWSGGWRAAHDGANLIITSDAGAVIRQLAWSDVRVFAFHPDTGSLSLTVGNAAGQDTAYTIALKSGQLTVAPAAAAGVASGTLTVGLATTSETAAVGSGITNRTLPTFAGTAPAGATIQLRIDGNDAVTVVASASGAWSYVVASPLAAGSHLVDASIAGGLAGAAQDSRYVVSVDPTQRLHSTLGLAAASDTGYPGDQITDVLRPTFAGIDDPGVRITVSIDGIKAGLTLADASGNWSLAAPAALGLGTHHLSVTAAGPPGTSPAPAAMDFTIDTAAEEAAQTSTDPLFDRAWYLAKYPAAAASSLDPYTHYLTVGWQLGYDPSPFFSTSYYLATYPDVAAAGINPLLHFEGDGWQDGRNPSSSFNVRTYEAAHPDLPTGEDPLVAYINSLTVGTSSAMAFAAPAVQAAPVASSATATSPAASAGASSAHSAAAELAGLGLVHAAPGSTAITQPVAGVSVSPAVGMMMALHRMMALHHG